MSKRRFPDHHRHPEGGRTSKPSSSAKKKGGGFRLARENHRHFDAGSMDQIYPYRLGESTSTSSKNLGTWRKPHGFGCQSIFTI